MAWEFFSLNSSSKYILLFKTSETGNFDYSYLAETSKSLQSLLSHSLLAMISVLTYCQKNEKIIVLKVLTECSEIQTNDVRRGHSGIVLLFKPKSISSKFVMLFVLKYWIHTHPEEGDTRSL